MLEMKKSNSTVKGKFHQNWALVSSPSFSTDPGRKIPGFWLYQLLTIQQRKGPVPLLPEWNDSRILESYDPTLPRQALFKVHC